MFWKLTALSASSPVDSILDRENFTLDELLDEEEIIQECKSLNSRLINFLRDREQIEQLLRYIVIEPPEDADSKRTFKFPFIACEIFTCEIDVILKALVEEEELMNLLFSFLDPNRTHSALLAGYFSKVVICLMLRKAVPLMNYVQAHQDVFAKLVDLIGITSIMEVLVRLVDADDHVYPNSMDVMQWLVDSNLLEMIADKLNHSSPPEVHANAAETLCAVTRTAPSPLATKLSSPSFVSRIFGHALENADSKSALVHSLTVCISLLDPRRSNATLQLYSYRSQHSYESPVQVDPETVGSMLPKLGDLLMLLNVSADEKILPTTYGELRPPLGKHRLKIVEFIAVLLKSGNDIAEKEMISSGTLRRVFDLMFEYPYNNALHHHVESIVYSCLESKNDSIIDHLFVDCHLVDKILQAHKHPSLSGDSDQPTKPASGKKFPKVGYLGHLTRISNKLVQLANKDKRVQGHIQENSEWNDWQSTVLQEHNLVENVYRWACGRPTALQDRSRDSDDETGADRDYDVSALADNLNQVFRYTIYDNDGAEEGQGAVDRDDQDAYFNDESAEVVISSLRLGDDQGSSLFTNSNWFAFQDNATGGSMDTLPPSDVMDDINLKGTSNGGNSSSDDEVVVGEDEELAESKFESDSFFSTNGNFVSEAGETNLTSDSGNPFSTPLPGWGSWDEASDFSVGGSSTNPFLDPSNSDFNLTNYVEVAKVLPSDDSSEESVSNGTPTMESNDGSVGSVSSQKSDGMPSLFEDDVKFVGVEPEGTEKAMEQALKEGIVGEAGPLKRNVVPKKTEKENLDESGPETNEFNDTNYWRVEQEVAVLE